VVYTVVFTIVLLLMLVGNNVTLTGIFSTEKGKLFLSRDHVLFKYIIFARRLHIPSASVPARCTSFSSV